MTTAHIYHHNDLDGRCAAAIGLRYCRAHGHSVRPYEMDYKDDADFSAISEDDYALILDFSFKPDVMADLQARADIVIWCDHHQTAKDYGYDVTGGYRDFTDKGLAGCECTWRWAYPNDVLPEAVRLIGDYDSWRLALAPKCFQFYEGLKLEDSDPAAAIWDDLVNPAVCQLNGDGPFIGEIIERGKTAIQYRDTYCAEMRKAFGFETRIGGCRAYALNAYRFGSLAFGPLMDDYDVCAAFAYDGKRWTVSLYSTSVDVSVIAKKMGGGGHKGAAGFTRDSFPFVPSAGPIGDFADVMIDKTLVGELKRIMP